MEKDNFYLYRDYIDTFPDGRHDFGAYSRLMDLKKNLKSKLKHNISEYQISWNGSVLDLSYIGLEIIDGETNPDSTSVGEISGTFCNDVYNRLSAIILEEIKQFKEVPELTRENETHFKQIYEHEGDFIGREQLISDIDRYIKSGERTPLVIYGESGSGKSAVIAAYARKVEIQNTSGKGIYRFIGITPMSSDITTLLKGMCIELADFFDSTFDSDLEDYFKIVGEFNRLLQCCSIDKPIVILLDALNQLSDAENAHGLFWLPADLPPHVSLITTTIIGDCYDILKTRSPAPRFIEMPPLDVNEAQDIFRHWMENHGRRITSDQWAVVHSNISNNRLPLYLKLIFLESLNWKSYSPSCDTRLEPEIKLQITSFFNRLEQEKNHGKILVSRCMGFFGAARTGLTEEQLVNIISRDTLILENYRRRFPKSPTVDELPVIVWSRLFFNLTPFITKKNIYGLPILALLSQPDPRCDIGKISSGT